MNRKMPNEVQAAASYGDYYKKKKKKIKFQGTVGESNPWCSDAGNVNAYRLYEKPFVWFLNH